MVTDAIRHLELLENFQMVSVDDDDLAGLEDVSSDGEDDNYEAEVMDGETSSSGTASGGKRPPNRKRSRVESTEPPPLMEGEGRSFKVLGFNQSQRALFVQIMMRFGVGDYDWKEFTARMKKTFEEIDRYAKLFLEHIAEGDNDSPTFTDGVPKDGLRIGDVLVRLATLMLVKKRVEAALRNPGAPLFSEDTFLFHPGLKGGKYWKEEHDLTLLRAVIKHGYGRWQAIVDDKDLRLQEVICQELNLPFINLPFHGQVNTQAQNGEKTANGEGPNIHASENGSGIDIGANVAQGNSHAANQPLLYQNTSVLYQYRDMQRRQVEYIKKRVLLLEKGNVSEYIAEEYGEATVVGSEELESEPNATILPSTHSVEINGHMADQLPRIVDITPEEVAAAACDNDPDRLKLPRLYNEMCKLVERNAHTSCSTALGTICEEINMTLSSAPHNPPPASHILNLGKQSEAESSSIVLPKPPSPQSDGNHAVVADTAEAEATIMELDPEPVDGMISDDLGKQEQEEVDSKGKGVVVLDD
ncbi:hypothetical protein ACFX1X_016655 [Malus domestica]